MAKNKHYWKLQSHLLAVKAARAEADLKIAGAEARLVAVMTEAGLDPSKHYEMNDAEESVTESAVTR